MKKFLAIFGTLTVATSSVGFLSNAFLANKNTINNEINSKDILLDTKDLTEEKITEVDKESQSWNNEKIDETLKHGLQYYNNQLIIDKKKLDNTKLPTEVLNHLDLALYHLNNAINDGYIKVVVNNNEVQLIYPINTKTFKNLDNNNSDIIYFDSKSTLSNFHSSYMWYSTYGPSHWWKFWEWGGYIHFGETAVHVASIINILATIANIVFLIRNIHKIINILEELQFLSHTNNFSRINELTAEFNRTVGSDALNKLGGIIDVLAIFTALASFILGLTAGAGWAVPLFELIVGIIASVTGQMLTADKGYGVKWKWPCFLIPGKISAE